MHRLLYEYRAIAIKSSIFMGRMVPKLSRPGGTLKSHILHEENRDTDVKPRRHPQVYCAKVLKFSRHPEDYGATSLIYSKLFEKNTVPQLSSSVDSLRNIAPKSRREHEDNGVKLPETP